MNYDHAELSLGFQVSSPNREIWGASFPAILKKRRYYGRVWRNGKCFYRNYGRELKNGRVMSIYDVMLDRLNRAFSQGG